MPDQIILAPFVKAVPTTAIPITQDPLTGHIVNYNPQGKLTFTPISSFRKLISSGVAGKATPTSSPTLYNPTDYPNGLYEKWDVNTAGTYVNFKNAANQSIVVTVDDLKINLVQIWVKNGVSELSKVPIDKVNVVDGFTSDSPADAGSAKNAKTLMEITKIGGARDWTLGAYSTGEVLRDTGMLWTATGNITSAKPGANALWQLYFPFVKPPALFISDQTTFTVNLVNNTCVFTGISTNKIITPFGSYNIAAQTVDCSANTTYYSLVFNISTNIVRAVSVFDAGLRPLGVNDYIICYVLNLTTNLRDVYGAKKYKLVDSNGTVDYPIKPIATTDVIYNKYFATYGTGRTDPEKFWLNKAIVDLQFYNIKDVQTVTLYGLGKNYTSLSYLGFGIAETGKGNIFLYADEFNNNLSIAYDANTHKGVKTYYLRGGTQRGSNNTIYGKITVDWDQVPTGRVLEGNSGMATNNSNILRSLLKKSDIFNNPFGFVKFAKSRSFFDYYSQVNNIESYASGPNTGVPKAPYQDCRQWALKWDEFVSAPPAGYSVTKEILTTDVPTDTNIEGKLPIYGYVFSPSKLAAGDATGNNAQTLPRIFINCSIHGFEKTPSFVVYEMMKQILTNWKSHSFLEYLRFNVEFCIIPFANPHGWNVGNGNGSRKNFNQVDLNRNFPTFWAAGGSSADSTYPGPSVLSEIEAQSIYTWMQGKVTSNTILGIDFHNFHGVEESDKKKYNMAWIVNLGSELGQSSANVLIKELSAKYKVKSNLIPQTDDYYIGQSNNYNGPGFSGSAMKSLGALYASTFEVCQNFRFNPTYQSHDSDALTFGVETFVNYLRVFFADQLEEYNRTK